MRRLQDKSRLATMMKQAGFYIGPDPQCAHAHKRRIRAEGESSGGGGRRTLGLGGGGESCGGGFENLIYSLKLNLNNFLVNLIKVKIYF